MKIISSRPRGWFFSVVYILIEKQMKRKFKRYNPWFITEKWYPNYFMLHYFYTFQAAFTCKQARSKQCYWYTSCHDWYNPIVQLNIRSYVTVLQRQVHHSLKHNRIRVVAYNRKLNPPVDCYIFRDVQGHAIITYYAVPILCYRQQQKAWRQPFQHCAVLVFMRGWTFALREITGKRIVAG